MEWLLKELFLKEGVSHLLSSPASKPDIRGQAALTPSSCLLYKLSQVPSSLPWPISTSVPLSLDLSPELQAPQREPEPPQASRC